MNLRSQSLVSFPDSQCNFKEGYDIPEITVKYKHVACNNAKCGCQDKYVIMPLSQYQTFSDKKS